jgi:hypothetical protein
MRTRPGLCLALIISCAGFFGCTPSGPTDDPSLAQLEVVARHLTSPRHLRNSAYSAVRSNGKPSELVSFLFSDLGVAEWPAGESDDPMTREQMQATHTPMFPASGALVHARPSPELGRQLVLIGDDASGEILAVGYLDPKQPALWTHRWAMPDLSASAP